MPVWVWKLLQFRLHFGPVSNPILFHGRLLENDWGIEHHWWTFPETFIWHSGSLEKLWKSASDWTSQDWEEYKSNANQCSSRRNMSDWADATDLYMKFDIHPWRIAGMMGVKSIPDLKAVRIGAEAAPALSDSYGLEVPLLPLGLET